MSMEMVQEGHIVHAVAMYNADFWLAWGDLPVAYEDPWTIGQTPPCSDSQTATETITKGVLDGTDQLAQITLIPMMTTNMGLVQQGGTTYVENTDYTISALGVIDWSLGGSEPIAGTTYTVKYRYTTDIFNTIEQEIGRRNATQKAYVVEDQFGSIVANGSNWTIVTGAQAEVTEITCKTNVPAAGIVDLDERILITAENGYANNIIVLLVGGGTMGAEGVSFDIPTNTLTITIEDGVSTEGHIAAALVTDSHIDTAVEDTGGLAWTLGVGTDTGTIIGGEGYDGGESFKFWDTDGVGYYVWITSDAVGVDPAYADMTAVPVALLTTDIASGVATKIATQLDLLVQFAAPAPVAEVITMTAAVPKVQQDAEDVDMLVGIYVSTPGTTYPTQNLYVEFRFLASEASGDDIYQIALFLNTTRTGAVPPTQEYLIPSEILDPGQMYMVDNIEPFPRSLGKREIFEFVIVY